MPIAGVGRVEPMDPDVKREVLRRARESGTFATDADATWVGSPLPASVNRRVVSRDATKRPGTGPGAAVHPASLEEEERAEDGDPSPGGLVRAFRALLLLSGQRRQLSAEPTESGIQPFASLLIRP